MAKRDWFDFLDGSARIAVAEEMMIPPKRLDAIGEHWGYNGIGVVCGGDDQHMKKIVNHRRSVRLGDIQRRLPIWC